MVHLKPTVLITGANGFLGRNVVYYLEDRKEINILKYTKDNDINDLLMMTRSADFIFHFAGENRSPHSANFEKNNVKLTKKIIEFIKVSEIDPILFFSSSVQAQNSSKYGYTKRAAEKLIIEAREVDNIKAFYYRFPNLFGQYSRPNYNSVIATFCYNISRNKQIVISDPEISVDFLFGQDIASSLNDLIKSRFQNYSLITEKKFVKKSCSLGMLASKLSTFQSAIKLGSLPDIIDGFDAKLFYTYMSFLPSNQCIFEIVDLDSAFKNVETRLQGTNVVIPIKGGCKELLLPMECLFLVVQNTQVSFKLETLEGEKPHAFECKNNKTYMVFPKRNPTIFVQEKRRLSIHLTMSTLDTNS